LSRVSSEREEKLLEDLKTILGGSLVYSDTSITKTVQNRDANGYITSIQYYAGTSLKFTLTITRDANNRITQIERT